MNDLEEIEVIKGNKKKLHKVKTSYIYSIIFCLVGAIAGLLVMTFDINLFIVIECFCIISLIILCLALFSYEKAMKAKFHKEASRKLYLMCRDRDLKPEREYDKNDFMSVANQFDITDFEEAKKLYDDGKATVTGADKQNNTEINNQEIAEKLFKMCLNNGLTVVTDTNKSDFMLMAKQFNISDFDEARRLFAEGEASVTGVEKQKHDAEKQKIDQKSLDYLADVSKKSELQGKEKYLSYVRLKHEKAELLSKLAKTNANLSGISASMASNERPRDWAIAGGLASAIGGPAAGAAAAAEIQAKNAQDAATRQDRIKEYREQQRELNMSSRELERRANGYQAIIDTIESAVADDDEDRKYFSRLDFVFKILNIDIAGNMTLRVSASVTDADTLRILNKPAFIDGSVYVYVLENGRRIGRTIVCAPNFDSSNANEMGFEKLNEEVYCRPNSGESFSKDKTYTFECEPIHIWAVQKW